jgi:hypothetical protein
MPIRPYLASESFDPETISEMSGALESLCKELVLKMIDDAATRVVAQKIIELTRSGVRGADNLHSLGLQEFQGGIRRGS